MKPKLKKEQFNSLLVEIHNIVVAESCGCMGSEIMDDNGILPTDISYLHSIGNIIKKYIDVGNNKKKNVLRNLIFEIKKGGE